MFCIKCGKMQADGVRFCASCGNPMPDAKTPVSSPSTVPPPANTQPPGPPTPPKNPNTALYVLLGVIAVVLTGAAVTVILLTSPQPQATAAITAPPATVMSAAPPTPTQPATVAPTVLAGHRVFNTPELDTHLLDGIPGSRWEMVGIATNPDQTAGEVGTNTLEDYEGVTMILEFYDDGTLYVTDEYDGETLDFEVGYHIYDTYCECDDDGNGNIARFYSGTDGNLYLTFMEDGEEITDYQVFAPVN